MLCDKPLIAHSIEQAHQSKLFDAVAVSSDSGAILKAAQEWGADHLIKRPPEFASDTAPKVPAIRHCVQAVEETTGVKFDSVVDLDATAPLRAIEDIQGAVDRLEKSDAGNLVTAMPARRSPYFNLVELDDSDRVRLCKPPGSLIVRRQDSPRCYDLNASVFVWRRDYLIEEDRVLGDNTILYEMPKERSIDIDSETDFKFVEFMMTCRDRQV